MFTETLEQRRKSVNVRGIPMYLINILETNFVPWMIWGTGTSRTIQDLWKSLRDECVTFRDPERRPLILDVHSAVVVIRHEYRGQLLELYEEYQVFKLTCGVLRRDFNGIAETIRKDEDPEEAAIRCLAEELGFTEQSEYTLKRNVAKPREDWEPIKSEKWPSLWVAFHRNMFDCSISDKLFRPDGYVEHKATRDIHFRWKPVERKPVERK